MTRRRLILIAVATLLLAAGVGVWLAFAPPASAINRTNALKIKPGMTLAEAILGGPGRDELPNQGRAYYERGPDLVTTWTTRNWFFRTDHQWYVRLWGPPNTSKTFRWLSRECHVQVYLDAVGRVVECQRSPVIRSTEVVVWASLKSVFQ